MKSYTDIEQSKKLVEILPVESADMAYWNDRYNADRYSGNPIVLQKKINPNTVLLPCWSTAALLNVIPYNISFNEEIYCFKLVKCSDHWICCHGSFGSTSTGLFKADNPVDACYELILKLHEQNLI